VALAEMSGLAGRGARVEIEAADGGHALLIDESYNANPASMRATLAQLAKTAARRRIAVLGSMKELGDHGPAFHAQLAKPLAEAQVDYAVLVGDEMSALADELGKSPDGALGKPIRFAHCRNADEARQALANFGVESGDAILVKGSNSVGLGGLVKALSAKEG
jgi:UDP-N-acetylmuramoyl-tripeptide--D-alanyl-D-alanine ligase